MKILLTGATGQVGWELQRTLASLGHVVASDVQDLDLTDADAIRARVREVAPRIIVNPAAHTAVDRAEGEPDLAHALNARAPAVLAEAARECGALLVHYSTDYVFDGGKDAPYTEEDAPNPLNVYGRTKLEGEAAIRESGARHLIFRTSWVYGMRGANFLLTMQRLMRERPELKIIDDQIGAPTWCRAIAEATALVLAQCLSPARGPDRPEPWGVYNLTCGGSTSWFGFAEAIKAMDGGELQAGLTPILASGYPTAALRPLNSRLDNGKLQRVFGIGMPEWRHALAMCLERN